MLRSTAERVVALLRFDLRFWITWNYDEENHTQVLAEEDAAFSLSGRILMKDLKYLYVYDRYGMVVCVYTHSR